MDPDDAFHAYAQAKADADTYLKRTDLAWTILGPSRLSQDPGSGRIATPGVKDAAVSRANVAAVIVATVDRSGLTGQTIEFNDGDTPIAEALADLG